MNDYDDNNTTTLLCDLVNDTDLLGAMLQATYFTIEPANKVITADQSTVEERRVRDKPKQPSQKNLLP
jgi:hypothetical protein